MEQGNTCCYNCNDDTDEDYLFEHQICEDGTTKLYCLDCMRQINHCPSCDVYMDVDEDYSKSCCPKCEGDD